MKRTKEGCREGKKEEEEDRSSLLTLLAFLTETNVTNVRRGRVMNPAPKCSSSSLMMEGTEGGEKAFP